MTKWIIENKDWVVPLSVALLSLIGATLGSWWSGRKRIGIEVLSKNRQEWINDLRGHIASYITLINHNMIMVGQNLILVVRFNRVVYIFWLK